MVRKRECGKEVCERIRIVQWSMLLSSKFDNFELWMAQSLYDFFRNPRNQVVLDKLKKAGVHTIHHAPIVSKQASGPFFDKTVVVTGTLEKFSRPEAQEALRKAGAKVTDSVSKKTDYLSVGAEAGSKLDKATKLGVRVLNEEEFVKMLK